MTRSDLRKEFRRRLREVRANLFRHIKISAEALTALKTHDALNGRDRRRLKEVVAAEEKLDAGTYGICESCGGSISLERLRAMPTARYCTACQDRIEKAKAHRKRSKRSARPV